MINRLRQIASHYSLSPAAFADQVGVSRPVISHIFSERNKPSLEVIQKIGLAFPELDLTWLLYGDGQMLKTMAKEVERSDAKAQVPEKQIQEEISVEEKPLPEKTTIQSKAPENQALVDIPQKRVVKIVFFYADNTFQEFVPGSN